MPKPIGNMTANLKNNDKVSGKLAARFQSRSSLAALSQAPKVEKAVRKPVKYKTRKK